MTESQQDAQSIFTAFRDIIVESTGYDPEEITLDSDIAGELAVDSLSIVEISVRAEDSFGVHIDDEAAASFHTVGDAVTYIHSKLAS
ncbi:acyl carrier protein [Corynebacterium sp. H127]|uniref:acyl carrier protein n=1 Tax=Corynebacterium sp. H127 TaxID=3133418 RepID=UPI0030AD9E1E